MRNHVVDPETGCWRFTGCHTSNGYATIWQPSTSGGRGRMVSAHRLAYRLWVGPVPAGHQVDHVWARGCRHRDCVRPDHLEPVTPRENNLRSNNVSGANARKTHCAKGHAYTEDNIYWMKPRTPDGRPSRRCKECAKASTAAYFQRKRTATSGGG